MKWMDLHIRSYTESRENRTSKRVTCNQVNQRIMKKSPYEAKPVMFRQPNYGLSKRLWGKDKLFFSVI